MNTVELKNGQIAAVQTLMGWLNQRITQIRRLQRSSEYQTNDEIMEREGRLIELLIIREKVLDGRIQGIGFDGDFKEGQP